MILDNERNEFIKANFELKDSIFLMESAFVNLTQVMKETNCDDISNLKMLRLD